MRKRTAGPSDAFCSSCRQVVSHRFRITKIDTVIKPVIPQFNINLKKEHFHFSGKKKISISVFFLLALQSLNSHCIVLILPGALEFGLRTQNIFFRHRCRLLECSALAFHREGAGRGPRGRFPSLLRAGPRPRSAPDPSPRSHGGSGSLWPGRSAASRGLFFPSVDGIVPLTRTTGGCGCPVDSTPRACPDRSRGDFRPLSPHPVPASGSECTAATADVVLVCEWSTCPHPRSPPGVPASRILRPA